MIDLTISSDIKPHPIFSYWETDKELSYVSLPVDTSIQELVRLYADNVLNRVEDTECLIYEYSRGSLRLLLDKVNNKEIEDCINKALQTEYMQFFLNVFKEVK